MNPEKKKALVSSTIKRIIIIAIIIVIFILAFVGTSLIYVFVIDTDKPKKIDVKSDKKAVLTWSKTPMANPVEYGKIPLGTGTETVGICRSKIPAELPEMGTGYLAGFVDDGKCKHLLSSRIELNDFETLYSDGGKIFTKTPNKKIVMFDNKLPPESIAKIPAALLNDFENIDNTFKNYACQVVVTKDNVTAVIPGYYAKDQCKPINNFTRSDVNINDLNPNYLFS